MLVKFDASDSFANQVKAMTGRATASKAFEKAAEDYLQLVEQVKQLKAQIAKLEATNAMQHDLMTHAKNAAQEFINHLIPPKTHRKKIAVVK